MDSKDIEDAIRNWAYLNSNNQTVAGVRLIAEHIPADRPFDVEQTIITAEIEMET
jgi:hypothetical protein